jgi:hypothetical protein
MNIGYFKAALICNTPLFLLPLVVILAVNFTNNVRDDSNIMFGGSHSATTGLAVFLWTPIALLAIVLLFMAKKKARIGRYAALLSIVVGVIGAIFLYPFILAGVGDWK